MSTLKPLKNEEITTLKTLLHETIPVTGSLLSGTYNDDNIKNYSHGMFQSVYDYPFLSSSANHIFDITYGINSQTVASQSVEKANIYHEMAQVLYGYDVTASVTPFKVSGSYDETATVIQTPGFINLARLLGKDEIQKGTFRLTLGLGTDYYNPHLHLFHIGDYGATSSFNDTNSPAGEYGILRSGSSTTDSAAENNDALGIIYYQAGVAVLDLSATINLAGKPQTGGADHIKWVKSSTTSPQHLTYTGSIESGTIEQLADALRKRINNIEFNNSTELNSTVYFCRAGAGEFNFSSNPTYLSASQIRVKENNPENSPISYITAVGLYAADGALVATAKLSEPIKKTPSNDLTIRVRLDY
tara:strand:- start:1264 stop:2340 length:1077 start_codon:yes stop_codon:yes gene_type:complete